MTKSAIRVEKTNINILGAIQPSLLKEMGSKNRSNDGFLARFLFIYPDKIEPNLFTGKTIKPNHVDNYKKLILELYNAKATHLEPTHAQIQIYKKWQHKKAKECHDDDLEKIIQSKLEIYVWRLALIIEIMEQTVSNKFTSKLSDTSINKAIKLVEYFRANALRVYDRISPTNPLEGLPKNKVDLFNALPKEFKREGVINLMEEYDIKGGTIARFLNNEKLFIRLDCTGKYKKKNNTLLKFRFPLFKGLKCLYITQKPRVLLGFCVMYKFRNKSSKHAAPGRYEWKIQYYFICLPKFTN